MRSFQPEIVVITYAIAPINTLQTLEISDRNPQMSAPAELVSTPPVSSQPSILLHYTPPLNSSAALYSTAVSRLLQWRQAGKSQAYWWLRSWLSFITDWYIYVRRRVCTHMNETPPPHWTQAVSDVCWYVQGVEFQTAVEMLASLFRGAEKLHAAMI